jgi:hypothetical protein
MLKCPACGAHSYPLQFSDPQNEVEENAVLCGSCKTDIYPFMKAMEQWEQEEQARIEAQKTGHPQLPGPQLEAVSEGPELSEVQIH